MLLTVGQLPLKNRNEDYILQTPFQKGRCKTDILYLYIFGLFSLNSIALSSYVYINYDNNNLNKNNSPLLGYVISSTYGFDGFERCVTTYELNKISVSSFLATFFYLLFFFFFIALLRWKPKTLIYLAKMLLYTLIIAVIALWISLIIMSIFLGMEETRAREFESTTDFITQYVIPGVSLIVLIPTAVCLKREGIKPFSDILENSCRALFCFRSASHFATFMLFYFAVVIIEIVFLLFIKSIYFQENLNRVILYISVLGGFYMYSFLYYFGVTVMSNTIASWHYNQDNNEIPTMSIWDNIKVVCRYHLGTVAFGATAILPFFMAIFFACKHTIEKSSKPIFARIFKFVLIQNITTFALIQTAVHGYNFSKSTKRSFDLMVKNYSISLVLIKVFEIIMIILVEFPILFSLLLTAMYGYFNKNNEFNIVYEHGIITVILTAPISMIIESAIFSTLLYRFENPVITNSAEMNVFHIPQDKTILKVYEIYWKDTKPST